MQRLKRYQAPSMEDAYARVREECGGDAEVVSSRTVRSPGLFGAPPNEYVEIVVRVSDEDLERRAKLAARLAAARAEAAAARAAESARAQVRAEQEEIAAALEAADAELAPPFVNALAGSGVVPDPLARPGLLGRIRGRTGAVRDSAGATADDDGADDDGYDDTDVADADDDDAWGDAARSAAAGPFAAINAARAARAYEVPAADLAGAPNLAADDVAGDDAPAFAPLRALPLDAGFAPAPAAPTADAAAIAAMRGELAAIRALLGELSADRLQARIDGAPDALGAARARLLQQGVAPAIVAAVLDQAAQAITHGADPRSVARTVERKLAAQLPAVARVDFARRPVVLFLVGPSGAGKTTMAMRLALDIRAHALSAAVAGIDVSRAGAPQQLAALGSASGVPVTVCYSPGELQAMVSAGATDVIVVDTPGHNGARPDRMTELKAFLQAARRRQVLLVLPATMKAGDLEAVTRAYRPVEPQGLVITRCDETSGYGALLTTAATSGLGVAYTAHGDAIGTPPHGGDNITLARAVMSGAWPQPAPAATGRGPATASTPLPGALAAARARSSARAG